MSGCNWGSYNTDTTRNHHLSSRADFKNQSAVHRYRHDKPNDENNFKRAHKDNHDDRRSFTRMHNFQENNKKGLLDLEKERQSRPGYKNGSENRDRSRSNQRVVDGPQNRPTFNGGFKNAISSHIEGKAPAARKKSNESSSGESPLSISVDPNNQIDRPENRSINKHNNNLGGKGPRKTFASREQEDSHNLSRKMNFSALFNQEKPANNAGKMDRSFDPLRREVYSEESSSRVQVVRPTGGILGNLYRKKENMITPKKAVPFKKQTYAVKNDSEDEEKEDFIQQDDSPRRVVSVNDVSLSHYSDSEKPYKVLTDRITSENFQVSSTPTKPKNSYQVEPPVQKAPITELKENRTKCAVIRNINKCKITTDGVLTKSDIKRFIRDRCDVYVKEIHYQPPNTECIVNFGNVENATGFVESIGIDCSEFGGLVIVNECLQDDKDKWNKVVASWNRLNGLPVSVLPILQKPAISPVRNQNAKYQNYLQNNTPAEKAPTQSDIPITRSSGWHLDADWIRSIRQHLTNESVALLQANKKFAVKKIIAKHVKKNYTDQIFMKLQSSGGVKMITLADKSYNHYEHTEIDGRGVILVSSIIKKDFFIIVSGRGDVTGIENGEKISEKDSFGIYSQGVHKIIRSHELENKVHFNFTNWEILKRLLTFILGDKKLLIEQYQKRIYSEISQFIKSDDIKIKDISDQRCANSKEKMLEQQIQNSAKQYNGETKLHQNLQAQNFEQNYSLNQPKNQYSQHFGSSVKDTLQAINQKKSVELSSSNSQENDLYNPEDPGWNPPDSKKTKLTGHFMSTRGVSTNQDTTNSNSKPIHVIDGKPLIFATIAQENSYRDYCDSHRKQVQLFKAPAVKEIIYPDPQSISIGKTKPVTATSHDLTYLLPALYINDMLIQLYITWLQHDLVDSKKLISGNLKFVENYETENFHKPGSIHVFSTHFWEKLTSRHNNTRPVAMKEVIENFEETYYPKIRRWTNKVNIFEMETVLIPMNEKQHWFLCAISNLKPIYDMIRNDEPDFVEEEKLEKSENGEIDENDENTKNTENNNKNDDASESSNTPSDSNNEPLTSAQNVNIILLDSMRNPRKTAKRKQIISKYLCAEAKHKHGFTEEQVKRLEQHIVALCPKVPQQNDGASCGMFLLEYIERIIVDRNYSDKISAGHNCEEEENSEKYNEKQWFLADDVNGEKGREKVREVFEAMKDYTREENVIGRMAAMARETESEDLVILS